MYRRAGWGLHVCNGRKGKQQILIVGAQKRLMHADAAARSWSTSVWGEWPCYVLFTQTCSEKLTCPLRGRPHQPAISREGEKDCGYEPTAGSFVSLMPACICV